MTRIATRHAAIAGVLLLAAPAALAGAGTYGEPPADAPEPEALWDGGFVVAVKFAPDGTLVFATLGGEVYRWDDDAAEPEKIGAVPAVTGPEWGLTGLAIPPDFGETGAVLVAYTTGPEGVDPESDDARGTLRVVHLQDGAETPIFEYPATRSHNGGRILVHDGLLYVATGDRKQEDLAAEPDNHVGKVLRMTLAGDPAPGNPNLDGWDPYVYSLGHRNPFGLAWDAQRDRLVESEPGQFSNEEVNAIEPGKHYGWPHCAGPCEPPEPAYVDPLVHYPEVITPIGMAVVGADYYLGAFNNGEIRRAHETKDGWTDEVVLKHDNGILDVEASPDNVWIYYGSWNGLWRFPTPAASLETVENDTATDPAGNGTRVGYQAPEEEEEAEGAEEPSGIPAPGFPVVVLLLGVAAAARARCRGAA